VYLTVCSWLVIQSAPRPILFIDCKVVDGVLEAYVTFDGTQKSKMSFLEEFGSSRVYLLSVFIVCLHQKFSPISLCNVG